MKRDLLSRARRVAAAALGLSLAITPAAVTATDTAPTPAAEVRPWRKTKRKPRLAPLPINQTRWLQSDIEHAVVRAQNGDLTTIAQLQRAFGRDGMLQGLLSTRTGGLIRLPRRFHGTAAAVAALEGAEGRPGLFEKIFPSAELERLEADGVVLGVGVGQFVQGEDDKYPTLVRLDPEFLLYRWAEDRWYYRSLEGLLPIHPGDGRWVLHLPRGRCEPWNNGIWQALARAFVSKEHAFLQRENYAGKLANPARVAVSPQGASEAQKQSWFRSVMAWGVNSVFGLTPGYDIKLLESNGRGFEVYQEMISTSDREYMVGIAGQVVTTDGGVGFSNADIHATIRADLIQGDGIALGSTLNDQALPAVVHDLVGPTEDASLEWDTRPPSDMKAGAESLTAAAKAIDDLTAALARHGLKPDVAAIAARFAVPVANDVNSDGVPDVHAAEIAPSAPAEPDAGLEPDGGALEAA